MKNGKISETVVALVTAFIFMSVSAIGTALIRVQAEESETSQITTVSDATTSSAVTTTTEIETTETSTTTTSTTAETTNQPTTTTTVPTTTTTTRVSKSPFTLSDEDRDLIERVVMSESGNQPYEGILGVAQCILDRAVRDGITPRTVVLSPNQFASPYKKGPVNDNVRKAVSAVFDDGQRLCEEPIYYFYAHKRTYSAFHESRHHVITIAEHKFFN